MPVYEFRPRPGPTRPRGFSAGIKAWLAFAIGVGISWLALLMSHGAAAVPVPLALIVIAGSYWLLERWR
ncbi:MAG: hypothetical protein P4M00_01295 [Azospirillaceae bacterium]|nr:hypothetical protein [Azospirillaceae bacterium]